MKTIAVLVGSNRKESINLKFAQALEKLAAGRLKFDYVDLVSLPMYNDDDIPNYPASAQALKDKVEAADGVLFVTPEYNRSIPPILKNAVDWASRPWGKNSWVGKHAAIVGASPGAIGTIAAQMHLRAIMVGLGTILMGRPEVYFQMRPGLVDENNDITDPETKTFLSGFIDDFASWVGVEENRSAA
ncbi:NADPH-dependent FMN reductase [Nitratireductor sp. ZSWI3]|uniref:NADPH-dependent FMN reductase n=1 Tax=Nitratireductor sp. ZSWI3 TaxID=2966359 RepID=UPI00215012F8|nr:NADPH-dependent FMN reductase [Nitratireductor sp. ZSWI3]MCR4265761.1 NAD(P)H-dependent oxidoreductase [Nitratireductor sp. ZSWI3]